MTPTKEFERALITEYGRAKKTLVSKFSTPLEKQVAKQSIDSTLLLCSTKQAEIILADLPSEYLAGLYIESDALAHKIPAYVGFDFTGASNVHLNRITRQSIGYIGKFNEEVANELKLRYGNLLADNELINQIDAHGWTAATEKRMTKMGFDKEMINLVKHQTTTNKMIQILEQQGLRGGMHPNDVAKLLQPHIRGIFGDKGITIDNIGRMRKVLIVDADGKFKWVNRKVTHLYHTTTRNYADIIARNTMLNAQRAARYATLQGSGFVKAYRSIAVMDSRTGAYDAMMHGQIVTFAGGPPYHPRCRCELEPIWKKKTGLHNYNDEYFEKQRDQWFWKQHQLNEFNKTLPKGMKLSNYNLLPKGALKGIPNAMEMRAIRASILKQPLAPMAPIGDKAIADDLWAKTKKDGLEHSMIKNAKTTFNTGTAKGIKYTSLPKTPYKLHHTHPNWDAPLSSEDIQFFMTNKNNLEMSAITNKHIYKLVKTPGTKPFKSASDYTNFIGKYKKRADTVFYKKLRDNPTIDTDMAWRDANIETGKWVSKSYHFKYEVTPR